MRRPRWEGHWYNHDHRHSGIHYVSPAERHAGSDREILARRHALYQQAKQANPARWTRHTRNWEHISVVTLNPERDCIAKAAQRKLGNAQAAA